MSYFYETEFEFWTAVACWAGRPAILKFVAILLKSITLLRWAFFHIFIGKRNAKSDETVNYYLKCTFSDQKTKQAKNSNWIVSFNNRDNPPRDLVERTLYTSLKLINSSSTIPKKMTPRNLCRFDQITYLIIRDIYIYVLWLLKCQFRLPRFEFLIWQSWTQSRYF